MKYSLVISLILWFCNTFKKTIINETDWEIIVAIAMPFTPKAGINKNPKINIGFKIIFKKKDKIKAFLYVLVSPSAWSSELKETTKINKTENAKIVFVY